MSQSVPSGAGSGHPVRILAVPNRGPICVLFLGPIRGLITHFHQQRSHACAGDDRCLPALHRTRSLWKGYAPVEHWIPDQGVWVPAVLEVTESAEEQVRGNVLRGQVWTFERIGAKRRGDPVGAHFVEKRTPSQCSPAFDLVPVLRRLFHCDELKLDVPNPLPSQVILPVVTRPGPAIPEPAPAADPVADKNRLAELWRVLRAKGAAGKEAPADQAEPDQAGNGRTRGKPSAER